MCAWNYSVHGHVQTACKSRGISDRQTAAPKRGSTTQAQKKAPLELLTSEMAACLSQAGLWNCRFSSW